MNAVSKEPTQSVLMPCSQIFFEHNEALSPRKQNQITDAIKKGIDRLNTFLNFDPAELIIDSKNKLSLFHGGIEISKEDGTLQFKKYVRPFFSKALEYRNFEKKPDWLLLIREDAQNNLTALLSLGVLLNQRITTDAVDELSMIYVSDLSFLYAVLHPSEEVFKAFTDRLEECAEYLILIEYHEKFLAKAQAFYRDFTERYSAALGIPSGSLEHAIKLQSELDKRNSYAGGDDKKVLFKHATQAYKLLEQVQAECPALTEYYLYCLSKNFADGNIENYVASTTTLLNNLKQGEKPNFSQFLIDHLSQEKLHDFIFPWAETSFKQVAAQGYDLIDLFQSVNKADPIYYRNNNSRRAVGLMICMSLSVYIAEKLNKGETLDQGYLAELMNILWHDGSGRFFLRDILSEYMFISQEDFAKMAHYIVPMVVKMLDLLYTAYAKQGSLHPLINDPMYTNDSFYSRVNFSDDIKILSNEEFVVKLSQNDNLEDFIKTLRRKHTIELMEDMYERKGSDRFVQLEEEPEREIVIQGKTLTLVDTWKELIALAENGNCEDFLFYCGNTKYIDNCTEKSVIYRLNEDEQTVLLVLEASQSYFIQSNTRTWIGSSYLFNLRTISPVNGAYHPLYGGIGFELQTFLNTKPVKAGE